MNQRLLMEFFKRKNKESNLQESNEINIDGEPLLELFKKRQRDVEKHYNDKKPLPRKISTKNNEDEIIRLKQEQVIREIKDILAEAKRILNKPEFKDVNKHGVVVTPYFNAMDKDSTSLSNMELYDEYGTGDEFTIFNFDLWGYDKCSARYPEEAGFDEHPVDTASKELMKQLVMYVDKKYPHYKVEIDGDWDTYSIFVYIKQDK